MTPAEGIDTPEKRAERARHAGKDRCPEHHRTLTARDECPECAAESRENGRETVEEADRYDGEATVELDIERALRTLERTRAVARTDEAHQQATLSAFGGEVA